MTTSYRFIRSALDAFIEARQRQADRYVSSSLLSLDEKSLAALGHKRSDLQKHVVRYL